MKLPRDLHSTLSKGSIMLNCVHAMKALKRAPEIVLRNGKRAAVLLKIKDYEELLDRLEDAEDLKWLRAARKKTLHFRKLDDVLAELSAHV